MRFRFVRALLAFVVATGLGLPLLYGLATVVSPPRTPDGYPVMPIGQAMFAMVFAPIVGGLVGYLAGRRKG
jgi:hypothetical protein